MRLFLALCSTSASPTASTSGGTYTPKRPRKPFLSPYQPPIGFFGDRPQASTVPSVAGFCSSALPSAIQSACFLSIACRSFRHRRSYLSSVFPTVQTRTGGLSDSSLYIWYSDDPLGVFKTHGDCFVPDPFTLVLAISPPAVRNLERS